jgi:Transposase DDE domain
MLQLACTTTGRSPGFRPGFGRMAHPRRKDIRDKDLCGLKYFQVLGPLLDRLHANATQRDHAGNRQLHFDQYAGLILLAFFSPLVDSLRGIQQASSLAKIQKLLGCERAALGSLSEAGRVFDPALLREIIGQLATQALPQIQGREAEALRGLTAVDGTLLTALPKMAWALWVDDEHRAVKMHLHFDVLKGVPVEATLTEGNGSETAQLRATLEAGRLYVIDRGYADYQLFQDVIDRGSSFIGRIRDNAVWTVVEERPLISAEAWAAGVRSDRVVRLGCAKSGAVFKQVLRVLEVETGKTDSQGRPEVLLLATDRLDLDAEHVALGYRFRWAVELFFRWFKCILGCRHLLSTSANGITIQLYLGIIASLLISLWTGKKPTKRTLEMLQFYFAGLASEEELQAHIDKLHREES